MATKKTNGWLVLLILLSAMGTIGTIIYLFYSKKKQATTTTATSQTDLTDVTGKIANLKSEIEKLKLSAWISQETNKFSGISQYPKDGIVIVEEDETNDGLTTFYFSYKNEKYWIHSQKIV